MQMSITEGQVLHLVGHSFGQLKNLDSSKNHSDIKACSSYLKQLI